MTEQAMLPIVSLPLPTDLVTRSETLLSNVRGCIVTDPDSFIRAGRLQVSLRKMISDLGIACNEGVKPYHSQWKEACGKRDEILAPYQIEDKALAAQLIEYKRSEEERTRQVEEILHEETGETVSLAGPPKINGLAFVADYDCEVIDFMALVKAVAGGKAPLAVLQPNSVELRKLARALRETFNIPGLALIRFEAVKRTGGKAS